ncbi:Glutathione S-transferase T3 [Cardamine amara subsp. amara]|uniref:Glutathione S-transferase T3 n=1 Tax=Cardamine amara subsp. amara TaxID=228776 RepID=A0ABD1C8W1_CARAN
MDSSNLFSQHSSFLNLLNSQQESHTLETNPFDNDHVFSSPLCIDPSVDANKPKERRERRKWSHTEDLVLISAWLNTSKDAVVSNEQKNNTFWARIAAYYAASPKLQGLEKRDPIHCKQRWQKINDVVCKFVGSYEAATKEKSSGQNEDDVMKMDYKIFNNDYGLKFTLEHAWRELRYDQKWCASSSTKDNRPPKRRKCDENSAQSSTSVPASLEEDQPRPIGVKASKAKAKRSGSVGEEDKAVLEFQSMWEIKQKDNAMKDRLCNKKLLDSLLTKTEPLTEIELALKNKLISDMLSN